ncbi:MAG: hypothetical protein KatS3mg109_0774 [Pirellulaceae bacterium]|nr:MAG: hypothetical protein KatS3mg109_0774 [Pirellulaceae bacterium]
MDQVGEGSLSKQSRDLMAREWIKQTGKSLVLFDLFEQWARAHKRATTYGRDFLRYIHPRTGRIHPSLLVAGTETGRFACRSPNLLNIPTDTDLDYRSAFIAPDGWVWANADYAAMEQRIAADLSGDPALLQIFKAGGDNHSVTAALMFHCKRSDVDQPTPAEPAFEYAGQAIESWFVPYRWTAEELVHWIIESGLADRIGKEYKKTTRQAAKAVAFLYFLRRIAGRTVAPNGTTAGRDGTVLPRLPRRVSAIGAVVPGGAHAKPETEKYEYNGGDHWLLDNVRQPAPLVPAAQSERRCEPVREQVRAEYGAKAELARIGREAQNFPCQGGQRGCFGQNDQYDALIANATRSHQLRIVPMLGIYDELLCLAPEQTDDRILCASSRN